MNQQQVVSPPQLISQDQIARRFMTKLAWLMAGGMFIDGFVLGYLGALMPSITADLHLSTTWQGLIGAASLIGIFFGAPIGGYFSDRFGRKPLFMIDLLYSSYAQLDNSLHLIPTRFYSSSINGCRDWN